MTRFGRLSRVVVCVGYFALVCQPAGASITFTDKTFVDSDWTMTAFGAGSQVAFQVADGGNSGTIPDPFREVETTSSSLIYALHTNSAFVVDPSLMLILSIDFSIDYKNIYYFGQGQSLQVGLEQGGDYYRAAYTITGPGGNSWNTYAASSLVASDFTPVVGSGSSGNPDFSASGAPITFGFVTDNSGGNGIRVAYDNFSATANVIPEPASLIIWSLLGALGITVGWWRNRDS